MGDVADQLDLGDEELVDLRGDGVDHHDPLVGAGVPVLGSVLDEVVADGDHHVGVLEAGHRVVARLQADGAERVRVLVVEQALGHERLRHRDPGGVHERPQRAAGVGADRPVAGQDDRVLGAHDDLDRPLELAHPGLGRTGAWPGSGLASSGRPITSSGSSRWVEPGFSDSATLNALRTTSGTISGLETRAFHFMTGRRTPIRSMYWCDSLCIRSRSDWPVSATSGARSRNASATAVTRFSAPGPEGSQAHAGPPGQTAVGVGHVGAALLVAHRHEVDRRVGQRLVEVERLLARDAEHVLDALGLEALHEHL